MYGERCLRAWSVSQKVVALSSGEAEYHGVIRGASVSAGMKGMFSDLGAGVELVLYMDASAAIGIAKRRGLGKIRHIEVSQLWLQEKVDEGLIQVENVDGKLNLADHLTKHVPDAQLSDDCKRLHIIGSNDRHKLSFEV